MSKIKTRARRLRDQCEEMQEAVRDPRTALTYDRGARRYYLPHLMIRDVIPGPQGFATINKRYDFSVVRIYYCPWTGRRLPGELDWRWHRELRKETGHDFFQYFMRVKPRSAPKIPPKFRDERWWVERDLPPTRSYPRMTVAEMRKRGEREIWPFTRDREHYPGLWRPRLEDADPPHLCLSMARTLEDGRDPLVYLPWTREYGIRVFDLDRVIEEQAEQRLRLIHYCPWCGEALPPPLRAEWLARLERHGLSPSDDPWVVEAYPHGLGSEAWWRQEGL